VRVFNKEHEHTMHTEPLDPTEQAHAGLIAAASCAQPTAERNLSRAMLLRCAEVGDDIASKARALLRRFQPD
jgi:hypothetical protein